MGIFSQKADTQVYSTGEDAATQNSRVYLLTFIAYLGIFLFGYDTGVAGGIVNTKPFTDDFGFTNFSDKHKADITSNVVSLLQVGAFFGALGGGYICGKLGRKNGLFVGSLIFLIGSIAQTVAMHDLAPMYAGRVIAGFGVGIMSVICPTYVAEMAPKNVRGKITGMFQIVVVVGVAASYWLEYIISVSPIKHKSSSWRVPIGAQCFPCVIMLMLLPLIRESPRWLITKGREEQALANLAWARKRGVEDPRVLEEYAEMQAAHREEVETTAGTSWKECLAPGMKVRFFIAFGCFFLQQWAGQNSISYYAPQIFAQIGLTGTSVGLLASGIYGIVKIVATSIFIFVGIERIGRKKALGFGGLGMSLFLWIIGAIFATHPPAKVVKGQAPPPPNSASMAMAAMIYCFVIPYCFSWGPVPWVYCSEIFPMRLRHYGMAVAAATQWAFNFTMTKITPYLIIGLPKGRIFLMFAAINILSAAFGFWLPETRGLSIEEMDVLFGSTTQEARDRYIAQQHKELEHGGGAYHGSGGIKDNEKASMEHVEHADATNHRLGKEQV